MKILLNSQPLNPNIKEKQKPFKHTFHPNKISLNLGFTLVILTLFNSIFMFFEPDTFGMLLNELFGLFCPNSLEGTIFDVEVYPGYDLVDEVLWL